MTVKTLLQINTIGRAKSVQLHPPWLLTSLYSGQVLLHNYLTGELLKSIDISKQPVRTATFITRLNWIVAGADDMKITAYSYLTSEKIKSFEAHNDYIRSLHVHPTLPYLLSSADDLKIRCWNFEKDFAKLFTCEGHTDYVMMVRWSNHDPGRFASASLDRTIKVWSLPSTESPATHIGPDFTLTGHEMGVNSIEYSKQGDKPFLISASDDCTVMVWDYHSRQCVQVLDKHTQPVWHAVFHPFLPLIISGSEDNTLRIWNSSTYRLKDTKFRLNDSASGRIWALATSPIGNEVAVAHDHGVTILTMGSEKPIASMWQGKLLFVNRAEVFSANVRTVDEALIVDGEKIPLNIREAGTSALYPQSISHHPNGRLIAVCGDGEYSILTAQALRNCKYGSGSNLVWSDEGLFATSTTENTVKVVNDNTELQSFTPAGIIKELYGGPLLGIKLEVADGGFSLCFFHWRSARLVASFEVPEPTGVYWSEDGLKLAVTYDTKMTIIRYDPALLQVALAQNLPETDEGLVAAFQTIEETNNKVISGLWIGDVFAYSTKNMRLYAWVGGYRTAIGYYSKPHYLLGYVPETSRIYLTDREFNVITYKFPQEFLDVISHVERSTEDHGAIDRLAATVPQDHWSKLAGYLYAKDLGDLALKYMTDPSGKFEIALRIKDLNAAKEVLTKAVEEKAFRQEAAIEERWRQIGDAASSVGEFDLAIEAYTNGKDAASLLLLGACLGDPKATEASGEFAKKGQQRNVEFFSNLLLHKLGKCVDILLEDEKVPEATLFCRTYMPSRLQEVGRRWADEVKSVNELHGSRIMLPEDDDAEAEWSHMKFALEVEEVLDLVGSKMKPSDTPLWREFISYDFVTEIQDMGRDQLIETFESIENF